MKTTKTETGFARHRSESGFAAVLVLLIILGILALVGVSYYFGVNKIGTNVKVPSSTPIVSVLPTASQPPTGDMSNWKTYTNTKYGYSFKYPTEWKIRSFAGSQVSAEVAQSVSLETEESDSKVKVSMNMEGAVGSSNFKNDWIKQGYTVTSVPFFGVERTISVESYVLEKKNNQSYPDKFIIATIPLFGTSGKPGYVEIYNFDINNSEIFDQILSTFKFTNSLSEPPKPISDLFSAINTKFNINLIPVEESEFYSTSGVITKKSWKIDFVNTNLGKSLTIFLNTQLTTNNLESAGGAGGGVDAYENSQIKCNHVYGYKSGDPTNWKDPFNYLSCAEK